MNRGAKLVKESVNALNKIGANQQAIILTRAVNIFNTMQLSSIDDVEDYIEATEEGKFLKLDLEYYALEPTVNDFLEKYLEQHEAEFIIE
ncbi:DMP19 family protein [Ureibacillus aquaedulcis]|uniref:DUF4375 domain-containing protein n=1 Tax=Ureibacillus aquaedulcis TaxID=3058421 RepID=A0ABT8GSJ5_9BACL|nr:DUF4375 domain-containing protein [Ureibacillus sp. BA0131]MDN4494385.1 DUF4375 domain-containing protein [Ureibacillus sp. BA0131]